ncbi:ion transporter [Occultella glacieicola]|uniref:Ion transporter n=1 Tax=Occultella glacieicola TaxID=2518684 RepID=A0ABY2DZT0_9MICO|nr:ion transporter [Occultella glacieicola]TDE90393.1 ion transporter [Occultella glacieicola]
MATTETLLGRPPVSTGPRPPERWYSRVALGAWVESDRVQHVVIVLILINAATLGLETSDTMMAGYADLLHAVDRICLAFFVVELGLKLYAFRGSFFRSSWNVFDLLVVGVALVPGSGAFGVLRSLRVLRVLRLVSMVPQLRRVVEALVKAVPGILSIGALLILLFYVSAVMATMLFGDSFPTEFGNLSRSLFTLFQIMTLDNWSIVSRAVLEVHPWAVAFFIPFVLLSAFTVLNLFIAVIVDAMQHIRSEDGPVGAAASGGGPDLESEIRGLRDQVAELTELVKSRS